MAAAVQAPNLKRQEARDFSQVHAKAADAAYCGMVTSIALAVVLGGFAAVAMWRGNVQLIAHPKVCYFSACNLPLCYVGIASGAVAVIAAVSAVLLGLKMRGESRAFDRELNEKVAVTELREGMSQSVRNTVADYLVQLEAGFEGVDPTKDLAGATVFHQNFVDHVIDGEWDLGQLPEALQKQVVLRIVERIEQNVNSEAGVDACRDRLVDPTLLKYVETAALQESVIDALLLGATVQELLGFDAGSESFKFRAVEMTKIVAQADGTTRLTVEEKDVPSQKEVDEAREKLDEARQKLTTVQGWIQLVPDNHRGAVIRRIVALAGTNGNVTSRLALLVPADCLSQAGVLSQVAAETFVHQWLTFFPNLNFVEEGIRLQLIHYIISKAPAFAHLVKEVSWLTAAPFKADINNLPEGDKNLRVDSSSMRFVQYFLSYGLIALESISEPVLRFFIEGIGLAVAAEGAILIDGDSLEKYCEQVAAKYESKFRSFFFEGNDPKDGRLRPNARPLLRKLALSDHQVVTPEMYAIACRQGVRADQVEGLVQVFEAEAKKDTGLQTTMIEKCVTQSNVHHFRSCALRLARLLPTDQAYDNKALATLFQGNGAELAEWVVDDGRMEQRAMLETFWGGLKITVVKTSSRDAARRKLGQLFSEDKNGELVGRLKAAYPQVANWPEIFQGVKVRS